MFSKILIANRGEIACRVARTARRMGVRTVGVYSDADARALHVDACDEAYSLGPAPPRESYLRGDRIIDIARESGAQAIHPGYGFLSENPEFAAAVTAAGLAFIGPPPSAIRAMGSKSESKTIMGRAGVALVPGYHGADQNDALLARAAAAIGYPVLIKASAGGGGKGMRVVEAPADFAAALASARREATASFGDDAMLLEKYLQASRHIEMQVFADTHGECIHLFERDCSVQRRHQKIIEEAPAPGMDPARRAAMGAAAIAAAKAIGYVGAGTVEFIAETTGRRAGEFYFMEMNTRLQVEHPVTEMITGLDLVEWQLRIAAGESLPSRQADLAVRGHAIETRIYAEDPDRGFLPSTGRIAYLAAPPESATLRIDTGVRAGDEISRFYDPMLAKLIVWGEDRAEALRRLGFALARYRVVGVATNVALLQRLVAHPAFAEGRLDTGLIARHQQELIPPAAPPSPETLALAALAEVARLGAKAEAAAAASPNPHSPWNSVAGWWLNSDAHGIVFSFAAQGAEYPINIRPDGAGWRVEALGRTMKAASDPSGADAAATIDGVHCAGETIALGDERYVFLDGRMFRLRLVDPLAHAADEPDQGGHLTAPMSGTIISVLVKPGDSVARGAPLLVLEAMKMEHTIAAPAAGKVSAVHFAEGDQVREGADLIDVDAAGTAPA